MSEHTLPPLLTALDADAVGFCGPGSDCCEVPDGQTLRAATTID